MAYKSSWTNSTPSSPCTVTISSTPTAGDILIGWAISDATTAGDCDGIPAGFTRVSTLPLTSSFDNMTMTVVYKKSDGTETSVQFTATSGNNMIAGVASFDGRDGTTFLDVAPVVISRNTGSTTTDLSTTPITDADDLVYVIGVDGGNSDYSFTFSTTVGTTGAWTTRVDQHSGFYNCAMGSATQATAGALTARCTSTNGGAVGVLFALRPAASAAIALPGWYF